MSCHHEATSKHAKNGREDRKTGVVNVIIDPVNSYSELFTLKFCEEKNNSTFN